MDITTPALIFPAISMLMLAYTNRFMVISQRIRQLHAEYHKSSSETVLKQIANLRTRFSLIRWMQAFGAIAFILCSTDMLLIHNGYPHVKLIFSASISCLVFSLLIALCEILISTRAIELELQHIEHNLE